MGWLREREAQPPPLWPRWTEAHLGWLGKREKRTRAWPNGLWPKWAASLHGPLAKRKQKEGGLCASRGSNPSRAAPTNAPVATALRSISDTETIRGLGEVFFSAATLKKKDPFNSEPDTTAKTTAKLTSASGHFPAS